MATKCLDILFSSQISCAYAQIATATVAKTVFLVRCKILMQTLAYLGKAERCGKTHQQCEDIILYLQLLKKKKRTETIFCKI